MSTAKVDKYKKEKYNRKKILARKKRHKIEAICACVVVAIALLGLAGKGIYNKYFYYDSVKEVDYQKFSSALSDVQNALVQTEEEGTEADDESNSDEEDTDDSSEE